MNKDKVLADIDVVFETIKQRYGDALDILMALDAIRAEVSASPWIKVSDRLPEDRLEVLVCYGDGIVTINEVWDDDEEKYWSIETFNANDITHWMPLPEQPDSPKEPHAKP